MYAVIFKAKVKTFDETYSVMASQLRDLALSEYGCTEFTACTEGENEMAISYWPDLESISAWKQDPLHQQAQQLGKERWYNTYQVEIVEILRKY